MHYLLIYTGVDGYIEKRSQFRQEHLRLAKEAEIRGDIILAGALGDEGSAFLFDVEDIDIVRNFANVDPYVINKIVIDHKILPWTTVIGKDAKNPI